MANPNSTPDPENVKPNRETCTACGGTGELDCRSCDNGEISNSWGEIVDCPDCNGTLKRDCPDCDGDGYLEITPPPPTPPAAQSDPATLQPLTLAARAAGLRITKRDNSYGDEPDITIKISFDVPGSHPGEISVDYRAKFRQAPEATINWSAMGSRNIATTRAFATALSEAIAQAEALTTPPEPPPQAILLPEFKQATVAFDDPLSLRTPAETDEYAAKAEYDADAAERTENERLDALGADRPIQDYIDEHGDYPPEPPPITAADHTAGQLTFAELKVRLEAQRNAPDPAPPAVKLTKAQQIVLQHLQDGDKIRRHWGKRGHWQIVGSWGSAAAADGAVKALSLKTPPLVTISDREDDWRYIRITPAGLAALAESEAHDA